MAPECNALLAPSWFSDTGPALLIFFCGSLCPEFLRPGRNPRKQPTSRLFANRYGSSIVGTYVRAICVPTPFTCLSKDTSGYTSLAIFSIRSSSVPNEGWITITNGGSGTGGGSFTISVSANPGSTDLMGPVAVMRQTLTVILGNPVGTPGTGFITISGGPRSVTICKPGCSPCNTRLSAETIYETGAVRIGVGGDTYGTTYGNTTTSGTVATNLASIIGAG